MVRLLECAHLQALKFGVHFAISREVVGIGANRRNTQTDPPGRYYICARGCCSLELSTGSLVSVITRNMRIVAGCSHATAMESVLCRAPQDVVVVGAATCREVSLFAAGFAKHASHCAQIVLLQTMQYLISRIENSAIITVTQSLRLLSWNGEPFLGQVTWENAKAA